MNIILLSIIILSIVLESFPISSSGHVLLFKKIVNYFGCDFFVDHNFDLLLHGPTALVVALFFYPSYKPLIYTMTKGLGTVRKIFLLGFVTDSLTVFVYFLFFNKLSFFPLWIGFLITALLLFSLKFCTNQKLYSSWNYKNALVIGCLQACALIPGISRFGSTFVAARWCGIAPRKAFELSFLLEWPISCAAFFKGVYTLHAQHKLAELLQLKIIVIMIIAMIGALLGLKIVQSMIMKNYIWLFSVYVMVIAIFALF